jgi:ATP-dependent RNA helicase DeaD
MGGFVEIVRRTRKAGQFSVNLAGIRPNGSPTGLAKDFSSRRPLLVYSPASRMTPKLFSELGLSPEVLKAIDRLGFEQASPIQAEAIPVIQSGRDVVGQSQTGSGKTAAFAIPAIEKIQPSDRAVQVLVLCPTRELAVQVSEEVHKLALFKPGVRALPIYGGQSYDRQYAGLKAGANFVIGTPGRVMDHMQRGTLKLDRIHTVILDEADEMLDMGFREDIEFILKAVPTTRQTVLFSATVPRAIEELIRNYTTDAVRVRIEARALTVPTVEQVYYEVDRRWKIEALTRLIEVHNATLGIIFCNTQRMVDDLSDHLQAAGYSADALHGGMAQAARDRVMKKFRTGGLEFLVATDVAARGIDVDDVQVVFNFDLPYDAEDYVHRIGRTGRAGRTGIAITFVSGREFFLIREIERFTRQRIHRGEIPSQSEIERAREDQLIGRVRNVLTAGGFPRREHLIEALLEEGFDSVAIAGAAIHLLTGGDSAEGEAKPATGAPGTAPARPAKPAGTEASSPVAGSAPAPAPSPTAPAKKKAAAAAAPKASSTQEAAPAASASPARPVKAAPSPVAHAAESDQSGFEDLGESNRPSRPPTSVVPPVKTPPAPAAPAPKPVIQSSTGNRTTPVPLARQPVEPATPPVAPSKTVSAPPPAADRAPSIPIRRSEAPPPAPRREMPPRPAPRPADTEPDRPRVTTTLWVSLGHQDKVTPDDLITCIQGHTGLPTSTVGEIEIHEKHSFVNVAGEHARGIVSKLNQGSFQGKRLRARLASQ